MKRVLAQLLVILTLSGCVSYDAKLPEVSASEMHLHHVDSAGSVTIDAVGVVVTDTTVTAKEYHRVLGYPFTHDEVEIKDYSRVRTNVPVK